MTSLTLTQWAPACAALLVALGLAAAAWRRHSMAGVFGAQLGGIGAALGVVAVVGPAGESLAGLVIVLLGMAGILHMTLRQLEDERAGAGDGDDEDPLDEDPLRW